MRDTATVNIRAALLLLALSAMTLPLSGCKGQQEVASQWTEQPLQIDGQSNDWPSVTGAVLKEENAAVSFANDAERFYILFRTRDMRWVRTIRTTGLTLYFGTEGKKSEDFFVCFKGGPTPEQMMDMPGGAETDRAGTPPMMQDRRNGRQENPEPSFTCFIKDRIIEKPIPVDGTEGPTVAFATSQGAYAYEFSIPLTEGAVRFYGLNMSPGQDLAVGAVWGDMGDRGGMKSGRPDGMGGGPPGGGGMGGGGRGGGGRGGGGRGGSMQRPEMPEKQEVWFKTTLAASGVQE